MQYLYGSGEAAALSIQAYRALARLSARDVADRRRKGEPRQRRAGDGATLDAPQFEPCGTKPLAVVLDIDETALLNLGFEADAARRGEAYDAARWERWEQTGADKVVAVPGATMALDAARAAGIAVIFNSNRAGRMRRADRRRARPRRAGPGEARHDAVAEGRRRRRIGQGRPPLGDRRGLLRRRAGRRPARRFQRPVQHRQLTPADPPRAGRRAADRAAVGQWLVPAAQPGLRHRAEGRVRRDLPGRHALERPGSRCCRRPLRARQPK